MYRSRRRGARNAPLSPSASSGVAVHWYISGHRTLPMVTGVSFYTILAKVN